MPEISELYKTIKEQNRGEEIKAQNLRSDSAQNIATDKLSFASSKTVNSHLQLTPEPKPLYEITPEMRRSFEMNKVINLLEEIASLLSDKSKI